MPSHVTLLQPTSEREGTAKTPNPSAPTNPESLYPNNPKPCKTRAACVGSESGAGVCVGGGCGLQAGRGVHQVRGFWAGPEGDDPGLEGCEELLVVVEGWRR